MHSAAWTTVCDLDALLPDVGVRALVGDTQVAVFRLSRPDGVFAIDAFDPFSGAPVLSRGIVGDVKGQLVVASRSTAALNLNRPMPEDEAVRSGHSRARVHGTSRFGHSRASTHDISGKPRCLRAPDVY